MRDRRHHLVSRAPQIIGAAVKPSELRLSGWAASGLIDQNVAERGSENGQQASLPNLVDNRASSTYQLAFFLIERLSHQSRAVTVEEKARGVGSRAMTREQNPIFFAVERSDISVAIS